jgi:hypothetical protein
LDINVPKGSEETTPTVRKLKAALNKAPKPAPKKIAKIGNHIICSLLN